MTSVYLATTPKQRFVDSNGNALAGGQLYSYAAGTSTPQATYTDSTGGTANANPVILDSRGECSLWLDATLQYKLVLKDAAGNLIWSVDNAPGASLPTQVAALSQGYINARTGTDGTLSFRNRLHNGSFGVNQRAVAGTVTLTAGTYGHDRWKAGASGCTYTFSTSGNTTVIAISAGSLMQVIEGANVEGGTYALSNQGSAQARIAVSGAATTGAYAAATTSAPLLSTNANAGGNVTVEFSTGSLDRVQLEPGTLATTFERRPASVEMALCQRYYQQGQNRWDGLATSGVTYTAPVGFKGSMRAAPTMGVTSTSATSFPASPVVATLDANGFWEARTANASAAGAFSSTWAASAEL